MAELQLGGKTIATQTGTAEPVIASNVTGTLGSGVDISNVTGTLGSGIVFPIQASPIQKIKTQSLSGAVLYSFDDVFSATYHSYEIVLSSGIWTDGTALLQMRLRTASGDDSSAVYNNRTFTVSGSAVGLFEFGNTNTLWGLTYGGNTVTDAISVHVFLQNPYLGTKTIFHSNSRDNIDQSGGSINSNTQYTGFTIFASNTTNFSGTLHLYGYR